METTVPGVYAVGDVTAKLMLAHVAEAQDVIAAETIAGAPTLGVADYTMMPRVTFCQPQVASFGLTEAQARADAAARGSDIAVTKFPFRATEKPTATAIPPDSPKSSPIARTGSCSARTSSAPTSPSCVPSLPWPSAGI